MNTTKLFIISGIGVVVLGFGIWVWSDKTEEVLPIQTPPVTDEQKTKKAEKDLVGFYQGEATKKETDTKWTANIRLDDDKKVVYSLDSQREKRSGGAETGTWSIKDEDEIRVELTMKGDAQLPEARVLVFRFDTVAETLTLKDFDKDEWGKEGIQVRKQQDLVGTSWTWLETTLSDETEVVADSKQLFAITFGPKNTLELTTDCNKVGATYKIVGTDTLVVTLGAMTEMYCESSQEGDFLKHLGSVETFLLEGSSLRLMLKDEAGTMTFTRK